MSDTTTVQFDLAPPSDDERRGLEAALDDSERHVLLEHGTEAPFCGTFLEEKRPGIADAPLPDKLGRGAPEGEVWTG